MIKSNGGSFRLGGEIMAASLTTSPALAPHDQTKVSRGTGSRAGGRAVPEALGAAGTLWDEVLWCGPLSPGCHTARSKQCGGKERGGSFGDPSVILALPQRAGPPCTCRSTALASVPCLSTRSRNPAPTGGVPGQGCGQGWTCPPTPLL